MQIILSPAKKMRLDEDLPWRDLPVFMPRAQQLLEVLRGLPYEGLKALLCCSDAIAQQNYQRYQTMDLHRGQTPALLAYDGIAYQYMAPGVFTREQLEYVQQRLAILSGFYGLLRPFDGVVPYRLEMQAKPSLGGGKNLYDYWGDALCRHLMAGQELLVDLASAEYSRAIVPHLGKNQRCIAPVFAQKNGGKLVEKGVYVKMARGEMLRYLAENQVERAEDMRGFCALGFAFSPADSTGETYVFLKSEKPSSPGGDW